MSYREENGQVVLTLSKEDYAFLMRAFQLLFYGPIETAFLNRLNEGNPHYTPYQAEEKK